MDASVDGILRVGVIGLGRLWAARHRPALDQMRDRWRVSAVYDQVAVRAESEAKRLGCVASGGLTALIERPDVDVVSLLEPQWFGSQPIELAARFGKPIYMVPPLFGGPSGELEALAKVVERSGIPLMLEMPRRLHSATLRLRELLATKLGPPRLVFGQVRLSGFNRYEKPGPDTQVAPVPILVDPGGYVIDWCRHLFQAEPLSISGAGGTFQPSKGVGENDFEEILLRFPEGAAARIGIFNTDRGLWEEGQVPPAPGFRISCEQGSAWLEPPDRLWWADSEGSHDEQLPDETGLGVTLNDQFLRMVRGEPSEAPTLQDALAIDRWLQELRTGRVEPD
ncbi:Gfo/Idh/MocA family oxidoreductase [soil metagenome]